MTEKEAVSSEISTAKEAVEKAKEAANKIQEYIDDTNKLIKAGTSISDIQKLAKNLDGIGKLSFVFGALSAGLELAIMLSGAPSPEEQIMKMIEEVANQISSLTKQMNTQFESLKDFIQISNKNIQLTEAIAHIDTVSSMVDSYRRAKNSPMPYSKDAQADIAYAEELLLGNLEGKRTMIRDAATSIRATLESILDDKSYFAALIDYSYGDYRKVNAIGNCCISYLISAMQIDGVLSGLKNEKAKEGKRDKDELTRIVLDESSQYYLPRINKVAELTKKALEVVSDDEKAKIYAEKYLEEKIVPKLPIDINLSQGSLNQAAYFVVDKFTEQWPWCRWYSIVYHPLETFEAHGVSGEWKHIFRAKTSQDIKFNLIVHRIQNTISYPDFVKRNDYAYLASDLAKTKVDSKTSIALDFKRALMFFEEKKAKGEFPQQAMLWLSKDSQGNFGLGITYHFDENFPSTKQEWDRYHERWINPNSAIAL